jgi:Tfp pilus assembly protein PilP
MRKIAFIILIAGLTGLVPLLAQETAAAPPPGAAQTVAPPSGFTYNPEGRRDPFKDLLTGRDMRERTATGETQVFIDDLVLFGIVKNKNTFTAMIGMPQGFPMFVKVGDKFTDGYVLSITESQVVLRKTHERGIPLIRPRDIIKEITEEL